MHKIYVLSSSSTMKYLDSLIHILRLAGSCAMIMKLLSITLIGLCAFCTAAIVVGRNEIGMVGSATVLPFAQKVAENYIAHRIEILHKVWRH